MRSVIVSFIAGAIWFGAAGQEAREIWDSGFRAKRPASPQSAPARPHQGIEYRPGARPPGDSKTFNASEVTPIIGVTLWRMRLAGRGDANAPRLLIQDAPSSAPAHYVAERIRTDSVLQVGDRIRLGFEAPRDGFLYVIDRERYSDGSYSDPYLIFPALDLNGGENHVSPGRLIEVPGQMDRSPALIINRRDDRYVGEELLILLTSDRLAVPISHKETKLSAGMVESWQRQWNVATLRLDMAAAGDVWTSAEKSAGASQRLLTQADPMPQSIYAGAVQRNQPVLFRLLLEVKP